jgi:hypothetical protein
MGINITVDGKRISIAGNKPNILHNFKNFFGSMLYKDFEIKDTEIDEVLDKTVEEVPEVYNDIKKDIKVETSKLIDANLIKECIEDYDIREIVKREIAQKILKVILRDAEDLVENALDDFEGDSDTHWEIQKFVRNTIIGSFK